MKPTVDIIIPVYNQLEVTGQCLESIFRYTENYRLIVIDNASDSPTEKYLKRLKKHVDLIRNKENLGWVKAVNQGMRESSAPYLCLQNNDTVVTAGWLEKMLATMIMHEKDRCGFVMPNSTFHVNPQIFQLARMGMDVKLPTILGFCVLVARRVMEQVGFLDEAFAEGYGYDETDYFERAKRKGWAAWLCSSAFVYHRAFTSFDAVYPGQLKGLYEINREIYEKKWRLKSEVG